MSLAARLRAIERRLVKLRVGDDCRACGRIGGVGLGFFCGEDQPAYCESCERPVNAEGLAIGVAHPDGSVTVKYYPWSSDPLEL